MPLNAGQKLNSLINFAKFSKIPLKANRANKLLCLVPEKQRLGHQRLLVGLSLLPEFVEQVHEGIVDHERDGNVKANTRQSRHGSFVERQRALLAPYLKEAVHCSLVLSRLQTLHSCLNDINWSTKRNLIE